MDDMPPDRRTRRRLETHDELVEHAIDILGTHGVAGLSLGELARRIGVRTPSLYTYFESKNALYDELFRRGFELLLEHLRYHLAQLGPLTGDANVVERVVLLTEEFARWHLDNIGLSQLMMFRPVPDWDPSPDVCRVAIAAFDVLTDDVTRWHELGLIRPDADVTEVIENITTATLGLVSRQLNNQPGVPYDQGRHARYWPQLITTLMRSYLPDAPAPAASASVA